MLGKVADENADISAKKVRSDRVMPVCALLLALMGLAFIYTSQSYNMDEIPLYAQFWFKQLMFFVLGAGVYFGISRVDYDKCFVYAQWIYIASIVLLIPLVIKEYTSINIPFVQSRYNATRWLNFGFFSLQPSEIAKIGTCIMVAAILARSKIGTVKQSLNVLWRIALVIFIPIVLIFLQPDLGSTLIFPPMTFAMLYVSNLSKRFFVVALAVFAVLIGAVALDSIGYASFLQRTKMSAMESASKNAYGSTHFSLPMKDYQRNRILAFAAPEIVDPKGRGVMWNVKQSLISIGSGGIFGKGLGEGTQAKLGYLPSSVAYNDFIFAVLAEESGFVGAFAAILLLGILILFCCLRAAQSARDRFGRFLCVGIATILAMHVFINVGMTLGIMPVTGLPLPMLSYGGSFVLTCSVLLGLVQSVYRHRQQFD